MTRVYCGIREIPKGCRLGTAKECAKKRQIRYYGLRKIDPELIKLKKKVVIKKTKPTAWTLHVKKYATEHGITYKEALTKAKPSYNKNKVHVPKLPPIYASQIKQHVKTVLSSVKPKLAENNIYKLKKSEVPIKFNVLESFIHSFRKGDEKNLDVLINDSPLELRAESITAARIARSLRKRKIKFDKSEKIKFLKSPAHSFAKSPNIADIISDITVKKKKKKKGIEDYLSEHIHFQN